MTQKNINGDQSGLRILNQLLVLQREMDGLDNLASINEKITKEKAESVMFDSLLAQASQGEPKASMALVDIYANPNKMAAKAILS